VITLFKSTDLFLNVLPAKGAALGVKITLALVHDGSCVGAAVLAAAALKQQQ
jgi:hexokinase